VWRARRCSAPSAARPRHDELTVAIDAAHNAWAAAAERHQVDDEEVEEA